MDLDAVLKNISIYAIPVLLAITLHEVAHGWMARWLGDRTAERLGRLSLNPLRHIDPIGTLLVPGLLVAVGYPVFGWAKPVPVGRRALRSPRNALLVALAGPAANLAMTLIWCGVLAAVIRLDGLHTVARWVVLMAQAGMLTNVVLALFNLLPIPPLDGGKVIAVGLPARLGARFERVAPFGLFIVFALSATHVFAWLFNPAYRGVGRVINALWVGPA